MSDEVPERMSEDMPDRMSANMPESMSESMSGEMPERMSENMPESMSERISENILNIMSKICRMNVRKHVRNYAEIHAKERVRLKCHGGDHSKQRIFSIGSSPMFRGTFRRE